MRKKVDWGELERMAGIKRTEKAAPTQADAKRMEQKILKRRRRGRT